MASGRMAEDLLEAVRKLQLDEPANGDQTVNIDDFLDSGRPRKKARQSLDDLKQQLEQEFLTPSAKFSPEWLNRLQQSVPFLVSQGDVQTNILTEDGTSKLTTQSCLSWHLRKLELSLGLRAKVSKAELQVTRKSPSRQAARQPRTPRLCYGNLRVELILFEELLDSFPLHLEGWMGSKLSLPWKMRP